MITMPKMFQNPPHDPKDRTARTVLTELDVDETTRLAVDAYLGAATQALRKVGAPRLEKAILFGCRARGTHTPASDADVALVLQGRDVRRSRLLLWDFGDMTYEAEAEFSFLVEPIVLWSDLPSRPSLASSPEFYRNVSRDGIEWPLLMASPEYHMQIAHRRLAQAERCMRERRTTSQWADSTMHA